MTKLLDIFWFFLKLGAFSFGGPNSHSKLMENEIVTKKHLLDQETFNRLRKESNSLPGPSSTQLAMKIGFQQSGIIGMLVAGFAFVIPSCLLMLVIALYYKEFVNGKFKIVDPFLYGIRAAVISILLYTCFVFSVKYIKDLKLLAIFFTVAGASFAGLNPLLLLVLSVVAYIIVKQTVKASEASIGFLMQIPPEIIVPLIDNNKLILLFAKIGALMIGSGYVIFAYLKMDLVDTNILPLNTILDTIAFGLFAPGPILSTVTFLGYQLNLWQGALFATLGFMIPIFVYAILGSTILSRALRSSTWQIAFNALMVASIAILFATSVSMGYVVLIDIKLWIIFILCLLILLKWPKLNLLWLIIISANVGYLLLHFMPSVAN
ncbi:MAG: chromate efflux transporter [Saprospiraceae bacterium]|jgi:chromate transporter|uniref:chromate efflux transporter n=1 Tax=Candidatus Brachybacter algidus TaxID=2982024 RepID=UPI001B4C92E7|nr:chromate efflux transporter [Candidatus Brachybacter algidus]MBP7306642.1 chromate efflux transporter [Saprospiraceae bacterium]MBK6374475.1 chromate efflux transporter [Candidatus Brachybacter algidus]MBK6449810.1 chromate efflux transporter [Candidatus Brachybacter algidus]MBK7604304.1 chromate efflux transporter [Candidatus Brachybacter algidus]MBK8355526.1 chromate efflux transporter [Candidatus Brachybacter algidus]